MLGQKEQMSLERFRRLVDSYGAESARWPAEEREAALLLAEGSGEARRLREEARRLDFLLDRWVSPEPSAELIERVMSGIPSRRPSSAKRWGSRFAPALCRIRWSYAAAGVACGLAALVLWLGRSLEPPKPTLTQSEIALLGTYTMPTDVLLEPSVVDLLDTLPAFGCEGSELACPDLEGSLEPQSKLPLGRRILG